MPKQTGTKQIASNRKAFHDYFVLDRFEAGIELAGTEVKSLRAGTVNMKDCYCTIKNGELFVRSLHISPYEKGNIFNKDPVRPRRLLMHKREIVKLNARVMQEGVALIPLSLYFKDSRVKVELGLCKGKKCLAPKPCPNLQADHREYLDILRALRQVDGVKKVFIRSGIRYDYLLCDPDDSFFRELVQHHVSGQLKVAPEHCSAAVLDKMGKPHIEAYIEFSRRYFTYTGQIQKEQYLVPYLMSSHPGSRLDDAIELACFLKKNHIRPEQVQDFYPTPGTISTCMFYTELDPYTMEPVYVAKNAHDKALQRALLQYYNPKNYALCSEALRRAHRTDLIGNGPKCLIPAAPPGGRPDNRSGGKAKGSVRGYGKPVGGNNRFDGKSAKRKPYGNRSGKKK